MRAVEKSKIKSLRPELFHYTVSHLFLDIFTWSPLALCHRPCRQDVPMHNHTWACVPGNCVDNYRAQLIIAFRQLSNMTRKTRVQWFFHAPGCFEELWCLLNGVLGHTSQMPPTISVFQPAILHFKSLNWIANVIRLLVGCWTKKI